MVTVERVVEHEHMAGVEARLLDHWMLDEVTAAEVTASMPLEGSQHIYDLAHNVEAHGQDAIDKRDRNRLEVQKIFNGESDKELFIIGPCSLDEVTDYTELFDYIEALQAEHPDAVIGWRGNGAKPRSSGGNTGLFGSTISGRREKQFEVYDEAFRRGIPIFTEITDNDQFAVLAPYLTSAWMGARDMGSTNLRLLFSATRLPVMVKNSADGKLTSLVDAVQAIGKNTEEQKGSGVNLGYLAATCKHEAGGPAYFTVGKGNKNVALIARGYDLRQEVVDEEGNISFVDIRDLMSDEESEAKALEHISNVNRVARRLGCVALLDGSHKVPEMMSYKKDRQDRFLGVLRKFRRAVGEKRVSGLGQLRGFLGEISVSKGITDPNQELTPESKVDISNEIREFKRFDALNQAA